MSAEEWERKIGLADMNGTVVAVSFMPPDDEEDDGHLSMVTETGGARVFSSPTAAAARQLAGALLDGADAMEGTS